MKTLLKILNWLPFNGLKTKLGILTAILAFVEAIDPAFWDQLGALLGSHPINWTAVILLVLGLFHKWLKNKYPDAK